MSRRYFFAYHDFCGKIFPIAWAEEDGICIGGRPKNLLDHSKWEITKEEFMGRWSELERKYPINLPPVESPSIKP